MGVLEVGLVVGNTDRARDGGIVGDKEGNPLGEDVVGLTVG